MQAPGAASQAIVVLGSGRADAAGGYVLSEGCHSCLALAARLAEQSAPRCVVFSGWSPRGGPSEAEQMLAAWPGRRDVELVAEPTATITAENMSRSLPLLRARGVEEALVVCDPLHLLRVRYFFASYRRYGIRVRYALTPLRPSLRALAWEAGAIPLMRRQRRRALAELGGEQP